MTLSIITHFLTIVYTEILTECTPVEWVSRFADPGGNVLCTCICCAVSQFDFQRFTQASAHSACTPYRQEVTKSVITKKVKEHKLLSTRTKKCLMEVCILSCATTLCYFLWRLSFSLHSSFLLLPILSTFFISFFLSFSLCKLWLTLYKGQTESSFSLRFLPLFFCNNTITTAAREH